MFRRARAPQRPVMQQTPVMLRTSYESKPLSIPDDFLSPLPQGFSSSAPGGVPIVVTRIKFASTTVPEYADCYAVVLDNVLTPAECQELVALAEQSTGEGVAGWKPALINGGVGYEFMATDYRNSDRIVWDSAVVVERLLARCMSQPDVQAHMKSIEGNPALLGERAVRNGHVYHLTRMNERMRFLRYGEGQFFRSHCDGSYVNPKSEKRERSFYTFQLYLNDSAQGLEQTPKAFAMALGNDVEDSAALPLNGVSSSSLMAFVKPIPTLRGGATAFYSPDMRNRLDIDPKAGRVLIFQHAGLLHSGEEVQEGIKYAMRSDFMYEWDGAPE